MNNMITPEMLAAEQMRVANEHNVKPELVEVYVEDFEDEETREVVPVIRFTILDDPEQDQQTDLTGDEVILASLDEDENLLEYRIAGSETSLHAIEKMIELLYEKWGDKQSASGLLYIPFGPLMQLLVGEFAHEGLVETCERRGDFLCLRVVCNREAVLPLRDALVECFSDIAILIAKQ